MADSSTQGIHLQVCTDCCPPLEGVLPENAKASEGRDAERSEAKKSPPQKIYRPPREDMAVTRHSSD